MPKLKYHGWNRERGMEKINRRSFVSVKVRNMLRFGSVSIHPRKETNTYIAVFGCDRCEDDLVNSCTPDSCSEYGMCQDLLENNFKCLCPITGRYTEPKCEQVSDLCSQDPCGSHGECHDYSVRYQCICEAGWTGKHCEVNINDCEENPNGCLYNGTCMDQVNGYSCTCYHEFSGDRCKDKSDFCSINPCPEGICYENYDTLNFMCKCEDPYRNNADGTCEMIPACDKVNCINGTCSDGKCICETGFEGSLCQHNIDNCKDMPCQHGGTCTDMINSYDCHCATGYDGDNCENNIDDCIGMCTGSNVYPNTNGCRDMLNDYQCICKAGYTGKNCSEEIDECLQQYPCEHGGTCTDKVADFECSCREGWTGKRCETPREYCAPSPCANEGVCYNLTDGYFCRCPGGTTGVTCDNSPEVCSIINPCTMKGTCQDKGGTAQCNCNDDYAGTSCQLIKDHCADPDMCNNEGQCVTKLIGFECECDESYSGSTCSMYTDPCSSNPCHSTAKCISNKDKYMCYCEQGNTLTDSGCKVIDDNFDIFMDRCIDGMPAYLKNPIVSHTNNSMTIMFWIRVLASAGENPVLLSLEEIQIGSLPTFNPEMQQFIATSQYLLLRNSTDTDMIKYDTDFPGVADGKWHFMVFSWEPSGKVKIFIDSIKKTDDDVMSLAFDINEDIIMQMIIGSADTHGRISKLRIYKTVFNDIDIFKAKDSISHLPSNELKQGWTNIVLTKSTFRKVPSGAGNKTFCDLGFPDCPDEDRTKPDISCPDDQIKLGTERLTAFTGLKNDYISIEDVKYVNTSVHDDELYIYGSSNEVFVAYDEAMNYDICRFKVYVKYAECQITETNPGVVYCPNSKNICGLNCPSGEALSIKHKLKYRCGALGVYNFEHPRKKFILPTCGGKQTQKIALTISISYKFEVTCIDAFKDNIKTTLETKLKNDLSDKWPGLTWCGSQCVWDAVCRGTYIDVSFTLPELAQTIQRNSETYNVREAILIFILQEEGLSFNNVAGAQLEEESVTVDVNPSCPSGYTVVGDTCVMCGKGTYRNDTTMSCEFCPIGSYQTNVGGLTCTSCPPTKTTLTYGSYSSSDCIVDCPPGQHYDAGTSNCAQCERHHYQHMSGQEFCYPCPLGKKTSEKGSNSSESCYQDCEAGTELQPDGSCKVCKRGYYRTQEDDECKSCQDVNQGMMTTEGEKSASVSDCKITLFIMLARQRGISKAIYRTKNLPCTPAKICQSGRGLIKNITPRRKKALEKEGIGSPSAKKNLQEIFHTVREAHLDLLKGKTDLQKRRRKEFLSQFSNSLSQKPEFRKVFCMATGIRRKYLSEDYIKPKPKKRRKDATSKQTTDAVKIFFKSETHSATISDKKSVKKDLQEKHVLMMSQKSLWSKWNTENQTQLSFSKFCELRPKNVLTQGHRKLYQCLCEYCENVKLKLIAINRFMAHDHPELKFTDEFDAVNKTLCPKLEAERFHKRDCIDRKCAECGTSKLRNMLDGVMEIEENQPDVKWKRWDIVKTFNHKTKKEITKRQEIEKTGPPTDLLEELLDELGFLSSHLFEARWQQEQFAELSKNFPENSIVLTIDFAENFSCFSQNEIQGAHWAKDSVTIHPCIALYRCPKDGEIVDECIDIQQKIKIDHAFIISDGCAAQYKSRVPIMDVSCSSEDFGFTVERCFYGSRHGKNRNIPVNEDDVHEDADDDMPIHEDADDVDRLLHEAADDRPILEVAGDEFDDDNGSTGIPDMQFEDINNISFDPNTSFSYIKDDDSVVQNHKLQVLKKTLYGSRICYAGNFRNASTNECEVCPVGWYQSEDLQDECEACPTSYTTDAVGKTHRDNCTFYCDPGMEVVSADLKSCRKCPRGSYRSNNDVEILLPCQNCTGGNTTELDGRITMDQCSIRKCEAGQIIDSTGACKDCDMDTYQPDELPTSTTTCMPCNDNANNPQKGTMDVKSTSEEKCIRK
ncbi:Fibropellin-3 [Mytilus coruscus]|uniref:Fibropellin-3 n=1 Tax=Mytilus coruscus TaxID=42192 RepID=A0A6J8CT45_MYTCO|nr:Fibropellin-3 [Mytilus coruscus]